MKDFTLLRSTRYCCRVCWHWLVTSGKKIKAKPGLLVLSLSLYLMAAGPARAQVDIPLTDEIKANFGVEADVYTNVNEIIDNALYDGTDDWFQDLDQWPGSGEGVIDVSSAAALSLISQWEVDEDDNIGGELRQSIPIYTTTLDGRIWIDAVYGRDQRTNGKLTDMSFFTAGDDKNFQDPETWTIGTGSGGPQKNDIIEFVGHLRRDNDGTINTLGTEYAIFGATTRSQNGTSHLDFELFRAPVELIGGNLVSEGTECNRTAYEFAADGSVITHGDVIFSVNYENGGDNVKVELYIWIDRTDFPNVSAFQAFNALSSNPFDFGSASGDFNFYECNTDPNYGYAQVSLVSALSEDWVTAQINQAPVTGPPWGSYNSKGDLVDDFPTLAFIEISLDATALGLDTGTTSGSCQNPLGSVIVKTRSSASFTAELKDLSGPYQLGDTPEVDVTLADQALNCTLEFVTLQADVLQEGTYKYEWFIKDGEDFVKLEGIPEDQDELQVSEPGIYKVRVTRIFGDGSEGCFDEDEAEVTGTNDAPELVTTCPGEDTVSCTDDISARFDAWLNTFDISGGGGEVSATYSVSIDGGEATEYDWEEDWSEGIIAPGNACGATIEVSLNASDDCEQIATCSSTFTITPDETIPEIVDVPDYTLEGCNVEWPTSLSTSWTDNCADGGDLDSDGGGAISTSDDGCFQSRVYTFTVTDDCGNSDTETTTVTREYDETIPEIVDVPDYTLEGCNAEWPTSLSTSWTDNCADGGDLVSDGGGAISTSDDGCFQSRVYTFTVTDDCGNSDTETTTVTREYDETIPEIVDVPDYTLEGCNAEWPTSLSTSWTDNCADGGDLVSDGGGAISTSDDGCFQSRVYTFTVTDDCGNSDTETTTVTREYDETIPEIVDVPDYTLEGCNAEWPTSLSTSWTDNCADGGDLDSDGGGAISTSDDGCFQSRVYTFTVTDDCGNSDTETTTVTREYDETIPEIVDVPDYTLEGCNAEWPTSLSTSWTDNCADGGDLVSDGGGAISTSDDGCFQSRVYTFTVTDDCGNSDTETTTVTREYDETIPEIVDVPDYTLEGCNAEWPTSLSTSWTDNCADGGDLVSDGGGAISTSDDGCFQSRVYTFTVTDDCGNSDTETTTVTREYDETIPEIVDVPDYTLEGCNAEWPTSLSTSWTDNCADGGDLDSDGGGAISTSDDGCFQSRVYTFTVTDDCGNSDTETTTVTREYDETIPEIVDVPDYTLEGCNAEWPTSLSTSWTDNCADGGDLVSDGGGAISTSDDGCFQSRVYTFTVTDDCGNSDTETTTVTREYDETIPEIVDVPDYTLEGCNAEWPTSLSTSWTDNCADGGDLDSDGGGAISTSDDGCFQSRVYTFTVTDDCGNSDTETTTVTREYDETIPEIVDVPDYTLEGCNAEWPTSLSTSWTDNCADGGDLDSDGGGAISTSDDGCFQSRVYTFTVTDDCGNSDTETTTVTREYDETIPEIVDVPDYTLEGCNAEWPTSLSTSWTDNCADGGDLVSDGGGAISTSDDGCFQSRVYTFTVTDDCGNSDTETTTVTREYDETIPEIVDVPDYTLEGCNAEWPTSLSTSWTDNCADGGDLDSDGGGAISTSDDGCFQSRVYTFTVTDDCGNSDTETTTVTREYDETIPEIVDVPDYTLEGCNAEWPTSLSTSWTDNCADGGDLVSDGGGAISTSDDGCFQSRVYTFTVTDDCGNSDTETTTVTREYDETIPEIVDVPDYTLEGCNAEWPTSLSTSWTDNCADGGDLDSDGGGAISTSDDGCFQSRVYTFTVTDDCGNSDTETTTVTREYDETIPEIVDVPDYTLEGCNAEWPTSLSTSWTDNCADGGDLVSDGGGAISTSDDGCFQSRVYTFTVTDDCGNSDTETTTVTREYDETIPEIVDVPDYTLEGCNAEWPTSLSTSWTDNCADGGDLVSDGGGAISTSDDGCFQSRVYTFTVTDDCGNSDTETTTVTREYDETIPEIVDVPDYTLEGCNAEWPTSLSTSWTDNCADGGDLDSDGGGAISTSDDGCFQSRVYTFTVTDDCGNSDTETTTVTREYDETIPEIVDVPDYTLEGCNAEWPTSLSTSWTDNCADGGDLVSDGGGAISTSDDGCFQSRVYTFTVTDDCGNSDTETTTVTREYDETNPDIEIPQVADVCDSDVPASLTATWTDNCSEGGEIPATPVLVGSDECSNTYRYTWTIVDDCGNPATEFVEIVQEFDVVGACETIFGYADDDISRCFLEDDFNRWGWTNELTAEGSYELTLYAGAGQCDRSKGAEAGTATIDYFGDEITVTYQMNGYTLTEAHVYIGCTPYPIKNGSETVAPGQYNFNPELGENVQAYQVGPIDVSDLDDVYVIVHGVACEIVCQCTPDANGEIPSAFDGASATCDESQTASNGNGNGNGKNNKTAESSFSASPVPFNDKLTLKYDFEYTSNKVDIQVYDLSGRLLRTYSDKKIKGGDTKELDIDFALKANQVYIIRMVTDREVLTKNVISSSRK